MFLEKFTNARFDCNRLAQIIHPNSYPSSKGLWQTLSTMKVMLVDEILYKKYESTVAMLSMVSNRHSRSR